MDSHISLFDESFDFSVDFILLFLEIVGMLLHIIELGLLLLPGEVELFADLVLELRINLLTLLLDLIKFAWDLVELVANFFVQGIVAIFGLKTLDADFLDFLSNGSLGTDHSLLDNLFDQIETTFPTASSFIFLLTLGSDDKEEVVRVLHSRSILDYIRQLTHNLELCHTSIEGLILHDTTISISHDRNKHVQESDLGWESRDEEEKVAKGHLRMIVKAIHCEFTQGEHILVVKGVKSEMAGDRSDNVIISALLVQL